VPHERHEPLIAELTHPGAGHPERIRGLQSGEPVHRGADCAPTPVVDVEGHDLDLGLRQSTMLT